MTASHSIRCPYCNKGFPEQHRARQHIKDAHPGKKYSMFATQAPIDDEPSMADLFIEAEQNRAAGIPNEDWIEGMLP